MTNRQFLKLGGFLFFALSVVTMAEIYFEGDYVEHNSKKHEKNQFIILAYRELLRV